MDVINVGSLNIDCVYQIPHFVEPGETLPTRSFHQNVGGKGLNQSIALARAGAQVTHVGAIGEDGGSLWQYLKANHVNTDKLLQLPGASGHAIIQVSPQGQNAIIIHPGTNEALTLENIQAAFTHFNDAKAVLCQNETSCVPATLSLAKSLGYQVFYNPAPMLPDVKNYPLHDVDVLILNEIEALALTEQPTPDQQLRVLFERWPHLMIILTMGGQGVMLGKDGHKQHFNAVWVDHVVDTTAAGDTFIGFFMAHYLKTRNAAEAIQHGMKAASICITQSGAACSIPKLEEVVGSSAEASL